MDIIHIVLGKANPNRMNGVNKVVYNLATKQKENGENVAVWGITGNLIKSFGERNFETQLFMKKSNAFQIPEKMQTAILKTSENTVFHLHGGWIPVFYSLSEFFSKHRKMFVITPHGAYNTVAIKKSNLIKKIYFLFFEKKLLKNCYRIHCIGKSEVEGINQIYKNKKTTLITYGFEFAMHPLIYSWSKKIIFGYLGRIDIFTKGLDIILDAFEGFVEKNVEAELWIIGDGKDYDSLYNTIKLKKIASKVKLFGSRFGAEKDELLQKIDVFLHPSRNEGLPVSVLEASCFGKPSIVSVFTNIGENIEKYNAGYMFRNYSSSDLTLAMHQIYSIRQDKILFEQMCKNAQTMVAQEFNWENILKRLQVELYAS